MTDENSRSLVFPEGLRDFLPRALSTAADSEPRTLGRGPEGNDVSPGMSAAITAEGRGLDAALALYAAEISPSGYRVNHPRYLSYVPGAPSEAALIGDLMVSMDNVYAGSREDAAGAIDAENTVISLIARLAGMPSGARGTFVSGGTLGNLSALAVARSVWRGRHLDQSAGRPAVVLARSAHSSVFTALRVLDLEPLVVDVEEHDHLRAGEVKTTLKSLSKDQRSRVCALVASAGSTNAGVVDDLVGLGELAQDLTLWLHVDAAYGGAVLFTEWGREALRGISQADSFIVDPHKWLFSPYDSCALIYRDPSAAVGLFAQDADYLTPSQLRQEPDPADLAPHLSRRARGIPLWMSLVAYGLNAYSNAVMASVELARNAADLIDASPDFELLVPPELSVVIFRRLGWSRSDYEYWSQAYAKTGQGLIVPTVWRGEPALRLCFVNPQTDITDVNAILTSLSRGQ